MNATYQLLQNLFLRNERVSLLSLGGLMITAMVFMIVVSLAALNNKATKGYVVNQLEQERQELVADGEVTDMMTLYARSMSNMEERAYELNMRKAPDDRIAYVLPVTVVAQN